MGGGSCVNGGASTSSDPSAWEFSSRTSSSELERDVTGLLATDLRLLGADLEDSLGFAAGRGGLKVFCSAGPVDRPGGILSSIDIFSDARWSR